MRTVITTTWVVLFALNGAADSYTRQPSIDVLHYDITIELSDTSDSIRGNTRIQVRVQNDSVSGMWLDFADMVVDSLRIQGKVEPFAYGGGRLSFDFDRTYSKNETVTIEVKYHGRAEGGAVLTRNNAYGRRVIFTDNWPDFAHHWFPSIDHPSDKATVDVEVIAPAKYDAVSNGRLVSTQSLLDGRKATQWSESRTIPTYCICIGLAEFAIVHPAVASRVPITWYSFPQDREAAAQKFRRTAQALEYFEETIAPYPYEKLAQVQSTIQDGGMENASAIFYSESSIQNMPISEFPVPHEIAHQWFGDSTTEADWDHLWLSEGFATYFDALFYEHVDGSESLKQKMAAYASKLDGYIPARQVPVIDPEQKDLMKKLSPINYEKGAWILHMLRGILGDATFFEGIRRYYQAYADGNAMSEDFQKVMETVSGRALDIFFRQWLHQPGWPEYRISWNWDAAAGEVELSIRQIQSGGLFDMPLDIAFDLDGGRVMKRFRVADAEHAFRVPLKGKPEAIEVDPDGWVLKSCAVDSRLPSRQLP